MVAKLITAEEALASALHADISIPVGRSTPFVCPHPNCGVFAQHYWGIAQGLSIQVGPNVTSSRQYAGGNYLVCALCESCKQEAIFVAGKLIWPRASEAPVPAADLPPELLADFEEARMIFRDSPRGAAALLRLLIQKLCAHLGSSKQDINGAIAQFISDGRISPAIQKALDVVRVIGNEAVHPGTLDLRDDHRTVRSLFDLVNFIVQKMITEPREIDQIYGELPEAKRSGIEQRDKRG